MEALPQRHGRHGWLDLWRLGPTNAVGQPSSEQLTPSLHNSTNLRRLDAGFRRSTVSAQILSNTWDYIDSADPDSEKGIAGFLFKLYEFDVYPRLSDGTVEACSVLPCGMCGLAGIGMRI